MALTPRLRGASHVFADHRRHIFSRRRSNLPGILGSSLGPHAKYMNQTTHRAASTAVPNWAVENPYLSVLAPRFFEQPAEADWSDLARRVVRMFTTVERRHVSETEALALADQLYALVHDGAFMPNSPVMMNSEHETSINLFACHVLAPPVDAQSMEIAGKIHDGCGGIGYDLTSVADPVAMTQFIETQTSQLNPTRKRKAHSAVTLHVDHPMVTPFIGMSSSLEITHTNVELDAPFFIALESQDQKAVSIWDDICNSIYSNGRPAIAFGEHKSLRSPNGERLILNVCGESLLRENESSLIGSLNASRFVSNGVFDDARFKDAVAMAVHCLDNLHDIQSHASPVVAARCLESRKIGISIMGYADALLLMGVRYGTPEALSFATRIMGLVKNAARTTSEQLAISRGSCDPSLLREGEQLRRNASLMAIAANGTLSLLANVSGGIEPIFSYVIRQTVEGRVIHQMQPTLRRLLHQNGLSNADIAQITDALVQGALPEELALIPGTVRQAMVRAHDLKASDHIRTQATFQAFIDGGISKTINLPPNITVDEISAAILDARASGCVGISLYRDGSISGQPSQMAKVQESSEQGAAP
ncbi:Ribonucleoside-diphosphate reductase NrdZ [compost metagenome]